MGATYKQTHGSYLLLNKTAKNRTTTTITPEYKLYTLFISNFIGIVACRTLHYQFYTWYFHSIPFLLWISFSSSSSSILSIIRNIIIVLSIEYSFNVFPATYVSSLLLQCMHWFILIYILFFMDLSRNVRIVLMITDDDKNDNGRKED